MNKKIVLFTVTIGFAYFGITSYSSGPAGASLNRTGAAGSTASCSSSGCHAASSSATTAFIELAEAATPTMIVSSGKYIPGTSYIVTIRGTSTPTKPNFGFQAAVTKSDNTNAGTLSTIASTNTIVRSVSGISIIEHNASLAASPSPGTYNAKFNWTAPAKGAGTVTFYGILNAVDGTGSTGNDLPSNGVTAMYSENIPASISDFKNEMAVKIYPNPCHNLLNIESDNKDIKNYSVNVMDLFGSHILSTQTRGSIDVSILATGTYLVQIISGNSIQWTTFSKQ